MKVNELRKVLERYNEKEKENIIVELYKMFPKKMKIDKEIDEYLENANKKKEKVKEIDIFNNELIGEMNYFIQCAKAGLYANPNRIVSKSDRSKWRFKVRRYFKVLTSVNSKDDASMIATNFLVEFYKLLSRGSETLVFSNWDTFRAIQVDQVEYISIIYQRILSEGINEDTLSKCLDLSLLPACSDVCGYWLVIELGKYVTDIDDIKTLEKLMINKILEYNAMIKKLNRYDSRIYDYEKYIKNIVDGGVYVIFNGVLVKEGIDFFLKYYPDSDMEVKYYILLGILKEYEYYEDWITLFEKNKNKIKFRDSLYEDYKEIKGKLYLK